MANVIIGNFQPVTATNPFNVVWKLTRALKKAGWIYKSSSNGSAKDTTGTASNDYWGGNTDPNTDTYSAMGAVTTGAQTLPTATLNTTTNPQTAGFPTSGTILVATSTNGWQTVSYTGTTTSSFTGCTGGVGTVPTVSAVGLGAINMDLVASWWNAQGPSTLKIPITTAQSSGSGGTFIRGENITQTSSGAQGELLGYLFDTNQLTGYLVVAPRVDGYGGDLHGWDHTHVITGNISGATVTPSAALIEFVREIVFWKTTTAVNGTSYYQCVDGYSESTSRFSVLAANANATSIVAPGGSGTVGNQFPAAGSFVVQGTGGANTPSGWFQGNGALNFGRAAFMATSASYSAGVSADGSFTVALGTPTVNSGSFIGYVFTRVDAQEDGDVDPYVWYTPNNNSLATTSATLTTLRTSDTGSFGSAASDFWGVQNVGTTLTFFKFWRKRGLGGATDFFQTGTYGLVTPASLATIMLDQNIQDREKLGNAFTDTYVLEDVWCVSYMAFGKMRKGVCRWLKAVQGGSGCDLYGGKLWIQLGNSGTTQTFGLVSGPWDGLTTQTQS